MREKLEPRRRPAFGPAGIARGVEQFLEDGLERKLRRLLRAPLQPVEIAKTAARAMEASRLIGPAGPQVANRYTVQLHPADYDRFSSFRRALEREVELYLDEQARRSGARPVEAWQVRLVTDEALSLGRVRVRAEMAEALAESRGPADRAAPVEQTRPLPLAQATDAPPAGVLLVGEREYALSKPLTTLGRAADNDIVLPDSRVSRYHALIERRGAGYHIHDLASTNGTFVSGRRAADAPLAPGDEVSLGGVVVRFRLRR